MKFFKGASPFIFLENRTYVLIARARLHSNKALNCPSTGQIAQKTYQFFVTLTIDFSFKKSYTIYRVKGKANEKKK